MTRLGSTKFKSVHSRTLNQPTPPLERRRVVVPDRAQSRRAEGFYRQQLKRLENRTPRDDSRLTMKSKLIAIVAAVLVVGCVTTQQPVSSMTISYIGEDYVVPENEVWKLTWKSPYKDRAITPAYDVRVYGQAFLGESRNTSVSTLECRQNGDRIVNFLSSFNKKTTLWVYSGTKISIANEFVKVQLDIFNEKTIN